MNVASISTVPVGVAAVTLIGGIAFYLYSTQRSARNAHSSFVIAWLLIALTPVFLVFTFFPSSDVSGTVQGFTLGGAIAAFVFIWIYGSRISARTYKLDQLEVELNNERSRIEELEREIARHEAVREPVVIAKQHIFRYQVSRRRGRWLGIITGDLLNVRSVDLWVNSENTNMQMSRFYEATVSAVIRYHGSRRDERGMVLEDLVADELRGRMGHVSSVPPATAFVTSSGELARTNNVRAIIHVAAVFGEPGRGYRSVGDVARCVTSVLDMAEQVEVEPGPRSIIFPLLGTGSGKAGLEPTAKLLLVAALDWLASDRSKRISAVYFLAYRDSELHTLQKLLAQSGAVLWDKS